MFRICIHWIEPKISMRTQIQNFPFKQLLYKKKKQGGNCTVNLIWKVTAFVRSERTNLKGTVSPDDTVFAWKWILWNCPFLTDYWCSYSAYFKRLLIIFYGMRTAMLRCSLIVMGEVLDIPTQLGFICGHWNAESPKVPSRYPIAFNYYRLHWTPERTKNSTNRKQGL